MGVSQVAFFIIPQLGHKGINYGEETKNISLDTVPLPEINN